MNDSGRRHLMQAPNQIRPTRERQQQINDALHSLPDVGGVSWGRPDSVARATSNRGTTTDRATSQTPSPRQNEPPRHRPRTSTPRVGSPGAAASRSNPTPPISTPESRLTGASEPRRPEAPSATAQPPPTSADLMPLADPTPAVRIPIASVKSNPTPRPPAPAVDPHRDRPRSRSRAPVQGVANLSDPGPGATRRGHVWWTDRADPVQPGQSHATADERGLGHHTYPQTLDWMGQLATPPPAFRSPRMSPASPVRLAEWQQVARLQQASDARGAEIAAGESLFLDPTDPINWLRHPSFRQATEHFRQLDALAQAVRAFDEMILDQTEVELRQEFGWLGGEPQARAVSLWESETEFRSATLRMVLGAMPVVSDVLDLIEVTVGREVLTGRELSTGERGLAALGLALPALFDAAARAVRLTMRMVQVSAVVSRDFIRSLERLSHFAAYGPRIRRALNALARGGKCGLPSSESSAPRWRRFGRM